MLTDYPALPPERRNVLDILFCTPEPRARMEDWEADARGAIAAFRREVTRANARDEAQPLIRSLSQRSETFRRFRAEGAVASLADGGKVANLPGLDRLALHYHAFDVEGAPHLAMVVYTPVGDAGRATMAEAVARYRSNRWSLYRYEIATDQRRKAVPVVLRKEQQCAFSLQSNSLRRIGRRCRTAAPRASHLDVTPWPMRPLAFV